MAALAFSRAGWSQSRLGWITADVRSVISVVYLLIVVGLAISAPWVAPHDPADQELLSTLQSPSAEHWLGTDDLGRDVLSRMIFGARVSLQASLLAVAVSIMIGVPLGLIGGWFGGWVDSAMMRVVDTLMAFPGIVLAIGLIAVMGPGLTNAMIAVGVVFSPGVARLIRAQVLTVKERLYIDAAVTYGASARRLIFRHILPNTVQPVVVQATFLLGLALIVEASLSFLGLGVQPPQPSWGGMLNGAFRFVRQAPMGVYVPGIAIACTVLAVNSLGDALRDALDPAVARRVRVQPTRDLPPSKAETDGLQS